MSGSNLLCKIRTVYALLTSPGGKAPAGLCCSIVEVLTNSQMKRIISRKSITFGHGQVNAGCMQEWGGDA